MTKDSEVWRKFVASSYGPTTTGREEEEEEEEEDVVM